MHGAALAGVAVHYATPLFCIDTTPGKENLQKSLKYLKNNLQLSN